MPQPMLADILPTPREYRFARETLRLAPAMRIHHTAAACQADVRSARLAADAIKAATGLRLRLATTTRYVHRHVLYVGTDDEFDVPPDFAPPHHEGFALRIDRRGALLSGTDPAGLFYAAHTLAQVLRLRRQQGRSLPAMTLRDWPELRHRAVMLDIARQVERPDYLEQFVRDIAAYRKNMFVLYFEDKFRWRRHPALGHPLGYTPEQFRRLAEVAEQHHVEFVPGPATLGHCEGILQHKQVAHLREDGAIYQLSLRHPGTRRLLADMFEEILPLYRGRFFHVNCDESPLLAGPPGSPRSYFKESLRLFGEHLVFMHDLLARRGKRMMVWGDMLLHHPQILRHVPRDILIVDWDYGSMARRVRQAPAWFREQGFDLLVAPAACRSAEVYYPPLMQLADNVPNFIRHGRQAGAVGEMTTLWEMRSTNPLVAWPGVVASAQCAWNPDAIPARRLARRVAAHLYGPEAAPDAVRAWRHLSGTGFLNRFSSEARDPAKRGRRTYHLDFHEFVAGDPFQFLTFRRSAWAEGVVAEAARGVEAVTAARSKACRRKDELDVAQLAGIQQAYHGERRRAVNEAGRLVVRAERLRRAGRAAQAAGKLGEAAAELSALADMVEALIPASRDLWRRTRHPKDPALENIYLRRLRLDRSSLRRHAARIEKARRRLSAGRDADLSRLVGGLPVVLIEAENPSANLIDILHTEVAFSADGRRWRIMADKGWFALTRQVYTVALAPGGPLPRHVRLRVKRTHINPRRFPLAERIGIRAARTLTPGEILDGPPQADLETLDWRLVATPEATYRLKRCERWLLQYELNDCPGRA